MKKNNFFIVGFLAVLAVSLLQSPGFNMVVHAEELFAPEPRLMYPITDEVDLTGKEELEFRWDQFPGQIFKRNYYEFCLYKGYGQYEDDIILKKRVPPNVYSFTASADIFKDGEVYTWSLRQVYNTMAFKSDASYDSFTVVKK